MKILLASSSSGSRDDGKVALLHLRRGLAQRDHEVVLWASKHPRMDELANSFSGFGEVLRSPYQNNYDHRGRSLSSYLNLPAVCQLAAEWQEAKPDFLHLHKQNLEDGLDLRLVANGVPLLDLSRHAAARGLKWGDLGCRETDLLFVGGDVLVAKERPQLFLERAEEEEILQANPQTRLVWIGEGVLAESSDAWVAAHHLEEQIQRLPWRNDVLLLLLAADGFLHVTVGDELPLALLEAMAAPPPCIVTPHLREKIPALDRHCSITIDEPGRWLKTLRDSARLTALGGAACQLAEQAFSSNKMGTNYEPLYHEPAGSA